MNDGRSLKQRLLHGQVGLGLVCRTLSAAAVELIGLSGFDFVWIDMEHTAADFTLVENLCRAADAAQVEPLVRVHDKSPSNILRALEAGARIVNVPQVEHAAEAEAVVRASKYHPIGERGYCSSSRGNRYGFGSSVQEIFAAANERVMTMVQIESSTGVRNALEICSVSGLDIVFVGMGDLSQSLGVPGQMNHPEVLAQTRRTLEIIRTSGKLAALHVEAAGAVRNWLDIGVRIFACGTDLALFGKTLRCVQEEFRDIVNC